LPEKRDRNVRNTASDEGLGHLPFKRMIWRNDRRSTLGHVGLHVGREIIRIVPKCGLIGIDGYCDLELRQSAPQQIYA